MCETEVANGPIELYYKLNNMSSDYSYFPADSIGKYNEERINITGLDFHIKLILTNEQPMKVMMLVYPQNSHLSMGKEIFVQCVIDLDSEIYTDEIKLRFSAGKLMMIIIVTLIILCECYIIIGLPGEPIEPQVTERLQCRNSPLSWIPKPNHDLSEIDYFKVELNNGRNITIIPATQWKFNIPLCSCEPQTCYKIVAIDKCGRCSNPVQLKWDTGKGKVKGYNIITK